MTSLKESVSQVHKSAEQTAWAKLLVTGKINEQQYAAHLFNILIIHQIIEEKLALSNDILRYQKIKDDIESLGYNLSELPITSKYCDYLKNLTTDHLFSHVYVHYLGMLYGGQYIKKVLTFPSTHLDFDNSSDCMSEIRELTKSADHNEAISAFNWVIDIYENLWETYK